MTGDGAVSCSGVTDGLTDERGRVAEAVEQASDRVDAYGGGVLSLTVHLSGDLMENAEKIIQAAKGRTEPISFPIVTPWGPGVITGGNLYRDAETMRDKQQRDVCFRLSQEALARIDARTEKTNVPIHPAAAE